MTNDHQLHREMGILVYGVILGGLISIVVNLWTAYFMKWIENRLSEWMWELTLILTSIALIVGFVMLTYWAIKQIRG